MRILVDQDEVLAQWVQRILDWYNTDHGTTFSPKDVHDFNLDKTIPNGESFVRSCMRYPDFYQTLDPMPGAIWGMERLRDDGHELIIVTAVPKSAGVSYHGKLVWLRQYLPWFDLDNFVACRNKYLVQGDILLDDGMHNVEAAVKNNASFTPVVFSRPWNIGDERCGEELRVNSWGEFIQLVDTFNKKERQ